MSSENFCLKWNDHHSVFFSNAEKLCHGSLLTDVVISAGGTLFQAHKLVLSVCSKFFQDVFSQPILSQPQSTVIYLKDVEAKHMQLLLSYMYRGEVDVEDNELAEFLKTASGLQIKGLSEQENPSKQQKEIIPEKPKHTKSFLNHVDSSVPKRKPERPVTPPVTKATHHSYQPTEEITIEDNPPAKRIKEESVVLDQDEPTSTWTNHPKPNVPITPKAPEIPRQTTNQPTNYMVSQTNQPEADYMDDYTDYSGEMMYEEEDQTLQNYNQTDQGATWKISHPEDKLNKAYPCEMCSMSFSQKWLLKRHWKTHTGDKPYKCSICLRSFSLRDSCTRHLKTVHKELVMTEDVSNLVEFEDHSLEPSSMISVEYESSPNHSALAV
eukprot:GFUD01003001.1.p1 GENE.GFUD01003001.1~~GFUD01003001.1.p1  ORF type:complete len:381 (-),score=90.03 GFUD01003001.1:115-1257(-)